MAMRIFYCALTTIGSFIALVLTAVSPSASHPLWLWTGISILLIREIVGSSYRYYPLELFALPIGLFLLFIGRDETVSMGIAILGLFVALRIADRPLADLALPLAVFAAIQCYQNILSRLGNWGVVTSIIVLTGATLLLLYQRHIPMWLPAIVVFLGQIFVDRGLLWSVFMGLGVLCVVPYALRTMRHAHPYYGGAAALLLAITPISHNTFPLLLLVLVDRTWYAWRPLTASPGSPLWVSNEFRQTFPKCSSLTDVPFERLVKKTRRDRETGYITIETEHEKEGAIFFEVSRVYIKRAELNLISLLWQTMRKFRVPFSDFFEEVRAYVALRMVDIAGPQPLAACTVTRLFFRRTALATLDIGPFSRLNKFLKKADIKGRREMLNKVARIVACMHSAAINHRDLYAEHIAVKDDGSIVLLDLNRVQVRHRLPKRWIVKDLAALFVSVEDIPATDKLRFFLTYMSEPKLTPEAKRLAKQVLKRSRKLIQKRIKDKQRVEKEGLITPPD